MPKEKGIASQAMFMPSPPPTAEQLQRQRAGKACTRPAGYREQLQARPGLQSALGWRPWAWAYSGSPANRRPREGRPKPELLYPEARTAKSPRPTGPGPRRQVFVCGVKRVGDPASSQHDTPSLVLSWNGTAAAGPAYYMTWSGVPDMQTRPGGEPILRAARPDRKTGENKSGDNGKCC